MASTKLTRTPASNGNSKTWTWSAWVKLSEANTEFVLFHNFGATTSDEVYAKIGGSDGTIEFALRYGGTYEGRLITNRKFRDVSGWYNFVFVCDTPNATAGDRQRIYVNGVEETSFSTDTQIAQDAGTVYNQTYEHTIGSYGSGNYFNGVMSHINAIDGTAYDSSYFGSTDTTTGEWEINTSPSVTYGTNGYFILKNGNSVTDESGNANNWTVASGTLTNTEDCPSNVFSTMNYLIRSSNGTYASGSNKFTTSGGAWGSGFGTLGMFNGQGKYYMEFKGASGTKIGYGISDVKDAGVIQRTEAGENRYCGEYANSYAYHYGGNFYYSGSSTSTGYDSFTSSDVIGMAVDMDNLKIYFHKNGTYQDSKNPASNDGYTIVAPEGTYLPTICVEDAGAAANFGNGVFDTTAISSEGTNASGIGKFEYDVPTGYTALSTKGLNE